MQEGEGMEKIEEFDTEIFLNNSWDCGTNAMTAIPRSRTWPDQARVAVDRIRKAILSHLGQKYRAIGHEQQPGRP